MCGWAFAGANYYCPNFKTIIIASQKFMHNKLAKLIKNCDPL